MRLRLLLLLLLLLLGLLRWVWKRGDNGLLLFG